MSTTYKLLILCIIAFTISACIDELNINTSEKRNILVVEGAINTLPGPHRILLSKSAKYGSILDDAIKKETNAMVWIRDEDGEQVFLYEKGKVGTYETPAEFRAVAGKKYTLFITLANGERYVSTPERIVPVPPLDSILVETSLAFNSGIELYARWKDPADTDNFYLWESEGIYILNSRPDLFVSRDFFGNPVPAPKDCCSKCYVFENDFNNELRIFKDNLTNGNVQTELVAFIPDNGRRFSERYMAVVKHSSLTKEAYQFFDLLKNQLSIEGDIFDPPPATIRGNMINLDKPDEEVIGYFRASDTVTDTVFVSRNEIANPLNLDVLNDDCRVIKNSTTEKPPFWR
ncbi:MAG TPA: DUF4249 domain-containing protein [Bacteroidetes bacterium]|nr:DUF4249 domain-containing protein [Bacteroidota bacterium]